MKAIIISLFSLIPALSFAASYNIQRISLKQGLSNNFVYSITQDKDGYVWAATEEGLNKVDGLYIRNYYRDPVYPLKGLPANELNVVYADKENPLIWIGSQRDGLCSYNYRTGIFKTYLHNERDATSLATNDITDIVEAGKGRLWICTYHQGIDLMNKTTGTFQHFNTKTIKGLPENQVWSVVDDGNGNLYVAQVNKGLSIINVGRRQAVNFQHQDANLNSLPTNEINVLCRDSNGYIWIGTRKGLALYDPYNRQIISFRGHKNVPQNISQNAISCIKFIDNKLWISTELDGIYILDLKSRVFGGIANLKFEHIKAGNSKNELSNATVRDIFHDSFGNIWLATYGGGLNFIGHLTPWFNQLVDSPDVRNTDYITNKNVYGVCVDANGRLWIGTDGGGINVFENRRRIAVYTKENGALPDNSVLSMYCDSKKNVWIGTYKGGLQCYDTHSRRFRHIFTPPSADIRCFYEDSSHRLWVGTSSGIYCLDINSLKITGYYNVKNSSLREDLIRSISQDKQGNLWVGTFGSGLVILSPQMRLLRIYDKYAGFCSNSINYIFRDSKGIMWVATNGGLVRLASGNNSRYRVFSQKDGLASTYIHAIIEDKSGNIWFSSNRFVSFLSAATYQCSNFSFSEGIPAGEFMDIAANDASGTLYFSSNNGLCYFNPANVCQYRHIPPIRFTDLSILNGVGTSNEQSVPLLDKDDISLHYDQNTFTVFFNVCDYALNGQVQYFYRLKDMSSTWYAVENNGEMTFHDMPYGKYILQVKAVLKSNSSTQQMSQLIIRIRPPFWLSWYAKTSYLLLILAAAAYLLMLYKKRLELRNSFELERKSRENEQELNSERLRFYTNITHELRTPLTLILGPLEDMQKDGRLSEEHHHQLGLIQKSALRLLNLINQILEFRKTETQNRRLCVSKGNLSRLIQEIGLKYQELNKNESLHIEIDEEEKDVTLYFDKEVIMIILDNLISNAIKYTPEGSITIALKRDRQGETPYVGISVSDSGYGIAVDTLPHIFDRYYQGNGQHQVAGSGIGLAIVKSLALLHEGEISVQSKQGYGSCFTLRILADNTYPNALHTDSESDTDSNQLLEQPEEKPILLIVEDNVEICNYIKESFTKEFRVLTAYNGKEGLIKAFDVVPDIIVSDIMMPLMDGMELCRRIKNDIRTSHIPTILLTAKDSLGDKEEGYQMGADSYITKPFSSSLLRSRINNLIESRKKLNAYFLSAGAKEKKMQINESLNKLDNDFIERITDIIEKDLSSDKIDVDYLSKELCMSPSTLYRKIKALTGISTNEYVRKIKMKNAEQMLLKQDRSVSEIAYMLGFSSPAYFRQCFKEEFGASPTEYIKHLLSKD